MEKLKNYLELANERHTQNLKDKEASYQIALKKIEAQNTRHIQTIEHKEREAKKKRSGGIIGTAVAIITFIILLLILVLFAKIITHN